MTESNIKSVLEIQKKSDLIENIVKKSVNHEEKIDVYKLSQVNSELSEIIGIFIRSGLWCNDPAEYSKHVSRLLAARNKNNDLCMHLTKFEDDFFKK